MENASKALIIAGGMLIAIMVASLFVYLFTSYGSYAEDMYDRINERQITEANNEYTRYEGSDENTIYDVVTVANKAKDHNTSLDLTEGERGYIRVVIVGENSRVEKCNNEEINALLQKYANETRFNCIVAETSEGLISEVRFTKR